VLHGVRSESTLKQGRGFRPQQVHSGNEIAATQFSMACSMIASYVPAFKSWLVSQKWIVKEAPVCLSAEVQERIVQGAELAFEAKHLDGTVLAVFENGLVTPNPRAEEVLVEFFYGPSSPVE